ncbi:peptidase domain-containing ABC transporter [Clostridium cellulovorans]|uniref:Peptidase C39 bacteriocin processing n=1 Tax=Clostridium cellulovorans (strain ATCC 35296 / DSM 3052 / OCM 3 / 743B) TaxID=573061 RepID=D9SN96_CLOC7|nr:peptidase domain-containing ABC transporter [Clostridium cellulovorans]ADL53888.1 peptidase C39 bacteriocin processing [Clostridium cellulovorans 743B]
MIKRSGIRIIKQLTETECGLCCCAMILRYYGSKESIRELQDYMDVGRDGISMFQIKHFLNEKGVSAKVYEVNEIDKLVHIDKPFICYWNQKHFVIVEKIKNNMFYIADPADGKVVLNREEFSKKFSKTILVSDVTEAFKPTKNRNYNPWITILQYLKENKILILEILILLGITYGITLEIPNIVQKIIDRTGTETNSSFLNIFLLMLGACIIAFFVSYLFKGIKIIALNVFLGRKLEANTYRHLLQLPYKFFETRSTGDLLYRIQGTTSIKQMLSTQIVGGVIDIGSVIAIIFYMQQKSVLLTICAFALFMINIIVILVIQPKLTQAINGEIVEQSKSQTAQIESLYSIISIKISAMEDLIYKNWSNIYESVVEMFQKRMLISNAYSAIMAVLQNFSPILILCLGINEYYKGNITIGEVIAFQAISSTFFNLGMSIVNVYPQFISASQYLDRIADIWNREAELEDENAIVREINGDIELEDVCFSYSKNSKNVLENISMNIKRGTKVAIVGASGSGKSSLSKILVGLYKPTKGTIRFDGIPIEKYDRKAICRQMGIVPQDAMLFNKSIYENIVMGNFNITLEQVEEITKIACIHDEIKAMPMGYHTIISEMGMNLSGGQRQRILLARSMLSNPKILVLDEATSSLDNINERKISNYLSGIGCTRIIIAHRLSTIVDADVIFIMKNGQIAEYGKHEELISKNGEYKKLYYIGRDIDNLNVV